MKIKEFFDKYDLRGGLLTSLKQKSNDLEMKITFGGKKTVAQETKFDLNTWKQKNDLSSTPDTGFNLSSWKQKNDLSANSDTSFNLNNWTQKNTASDAGTDFNLDNKNQKNDYSTEMKSLRLVFQNIFEFESDIPARKFDGDPITEISLTPKGLDMNTGELIVRFSVECPNGIKSFKFLGRRMEMFADEK